MGQNLNMFATISSALFAFVKLGFLHSSLLYRGVVVVVVVKLEFK